MLNTNNNQQQQQQPAQKNSSSVPKDSFGFDLTLGSIEAVENAMKQMDVKYHTQFHSWIKNENNVDYISYYLRKVITEFEDKDFSSITRAIKWLVKGWSVQRTAELLIKLFYHWGIGNYKFAKLVSEITVDWQVQTQIVDLVVTLVIGERSSKTARFIKCISEDWNNAQKTIQLVTLVSSRLRWTERYFKHFILQYICLDNSLWEHKKALVTYIREQYNIRKCVLQQQLINQIPVIYYKGFDFSINLFIETLARLESPTLLKEQINQNNAENSISTNEWEWEVAQITKNNTNKQSLKNSENSTFDPSTIDQRFSNNNNSGM